MNEPSSFLCAGGCREELTAHTYQIEHHACIKKKARLVDLSIDCLARRQIKKGWTDYEVLQITVPRFCLYRRSILGLDYHKLIHSSEQNKKGSTEQRTGRAKEIATKAKRKSTHTKQGQLCKPLNRTEQFKRGRGEEATKAPGVLVRVRRALRAVCTGTRVNYFILMAIRATDCIMVHSARVENCWLPRTAW